MKLFLGITLTPTFREKMRQAYEPLKKDYPYFNWVPEENYHITVAYLGERSEEKMPVIQEAIEQSVFDIPPTTVFANETGMFVYPGIVLRLSYVKNKELEKIRERVIDLFSVEKENKAHESYLPHTTIARYKLPSKQQYFHLKKKLSKIEIDEEFAVHQLHLFKSITKPTNPEYEILHTFELVE